MAKKTTAQENRSFHRELFQELVTLSTSGFGLVAALAWNEAIQTFVKDYIERFFPSQSSFFSQIIYAVFITIFAVLITYQLSRLVSKFTSKM